jgi:hypothetical protein
VLEMFGNLFNRELDLSRINYGLISLIHKLKEANNIKQFRPIYLLGVDYKWFTKVLTMRLIVVADSIISKTQTTFLPGRNIVDGVVVLHETLHEMRRRKRKGMIIKLDFEKVYDKVLWPFLMEVLERKFFPVKWIEWIQQVVTGGRVGINLNGDPGNFFRTFKGLREGDPFSPLLFNLVVDALATLMKKAREASLIRGLVPELVEGGLTHLEYADDIVICLEIDDDSISNTKFLLYCLKICLDKR